MRSDVLLDRLARIRRAGAIVVVLGVGLAVFSPGLVVPAYATVSAVTAKNQPNLKEGTVYPGLVVGTFTGTDVASSYSATVTWGDGTTSPGSVSDDVFNPGPGKFVVFISPSIATPPYADEGTFALSFIVFDDGEHLSYPSPTATATVGESDSLTLSGVLVSATAGRPFSGTVATVKNAFTGTRAADFTATINWGDGSGNLAGVVSGSGGTFTVNGGHTYATAGNFGISVAVRDDSPGTAFAGGLVSSAHVVDPTPTTSPTAVFSAPTAAVAGSPTGFDGSGSSDPGGTITGYSWDFGDGSKAGTGVTPQHTYANAGTYTVKLTVTDNAGKSGAASRQVMVAAPGTTTTPPPTISGAKISPSAFRPDRGSGPDATTGTKRGARVTFTLSHAATVTFTVQRRLSGRKVGRSCVRQTRSNRAKKRCSRLVVVGTFTRAGVAGSNSFHFTGRANRRPLARRELLAEHGCDRRHRPEIQASVASPFRTIK